MKSSIMVGFILLLLQCGFMSEIISQERADRYQLVDTLADEFIMKTGIPGVSMAVARDGKIVYAKAFGYADIENKVPMTVSTRLRTASVTKVITATALGRLASEDKLDFDEPIQNYVPYLNQQFKNLTVQQLAGHTSGVQHRPPKRKLTNKHYTSVKETIALFEDTKLQFEPDTDYEYATNGYNLLSAVIEGASKRTYADFMKEGIFDPLGMTMTTPENIQELNPADAKLYYMEKGIAQLDNELIDGSYKLAGAGFRSTPTDLVKMMGAYSSGFIDREVIKRMITSHKLSNGTRTKVGIGWRTNYDFEGRYHLDHAGNWQGARTVLAFYPEEQLSIAIMINAKASILIEETAQIFASVFLDDGKYDVNANVLNKDIRTTFTSSDGEERIYLGQLSIEGNSGLIVLDTDKDFLKEIPILRLSSKNSYAAFTSYGILYLNLNQSNSLSGQMFWYQNRNDENPVKKTPMLSLKER